MKVYDYYDSPLGKMLLVAAPEGLSGIYFVGQKYYAVPGGAEKIPDHGVLRKTKRQLQEYFEGRRRRFELPLAPEGSEFQRAVWRAIATVGFGETISYAELARRAGHPGSARAAGAATGRNPIGVVVPCHRIVGSSGSLTGYAGGLEKKKKLLALEAGEFELA